jgi:hypothetical protein
MVCAEKVLAARESSPNKVASGFLSSRPACRHRN